MRGPFIPAGGKKSKKHLKKKFLKVFPEGYCDGINWVTCSASPDFIEEGSLIMKGSDDCLYKVCHIDCSIEAWEENNVSD
jgi:hypothetical protein